MGNCYTRLDCIRFIHGGYVVWTIGGTNKMKCVESFVYGVVFGIMFLIMLMGWFPENKDCQVKMSYGNGKASYITVGVLKGGI